MRVPHFAACVLTSLPLTIAGVVGCAPHRQAVPAAAAAAAFQQMDESADTALVLAIENRNWSDVVVYVIHDGVRTRFAQITAAKTVTMGIPTRLVGANGAVQFLVHRIGGHDDAMAPAGGPEFATPRDDYLSPPVSVRTGYTVTLTLEDKLQRSTVAVW